MHEAGFRALNIKAFYLVLDTGAVEFKRLLRGRRQLLLDGFNVTVPYKEPALRGLDKIEPAAKAIGAVNTAFRRGKRWTGTNTDAFGFAESLKKDAHFSGRRKNVLVLGAGGSARAVVYALGKAGAAEIHIANRHPERAKKLARDLRKYFPRTRFETSDLGRAKMRAAMDAADLIVNTTSAGLKAGETPVPAVCFPRKRRKCFFDLIYRPAETRFLKEARKRGHRTFNGLGMLLYQGAKSFECWTGRKAPLREMRRALREALNS